MVSPPAKVPAAPPAQLSLDRDRDLTTWTGLLWRIHRTSGPNVLGWNELRTYGPISWMRWDPHPEPTGEHADCGVLYAATDIATTVAEAFQRNRRIDTVSGSPRLTSWSPTRPLTLLDLTGTWPIRNGAAHALNSAPRSTCRAWARGIRSAWPELDGMLVVSTMTGRPVIVVLNPAGSAMPPTPELSLPLAEPRIRLQLLLTADQLGYAM